VVALANRQRAGPRKKKRNLNSWQGGRFVQADAAGMPFFINFSRGKCLGVVDEGQA